jgi:hypothetical protein
MDNFYGGAGFRQVLRMRRSDEDLVECAEWPTQKKSPDLRGSWEVPGALVYLETEKLVFAVADWLPLTALAVS